MVFNPTIIAPGTTKTTMLLKACRNHGPTIGIKPKLTIPASINAMDAIKKGVVSLAVRLNNPTNNPNNTNEVTNNSVEIYALKNPATKDTINPAKKA